MLCYRCGSHVPDGATKCAVCGQPLSANRRPTISGLDKGRGPGPLSEGQTFADRYLIKDILSVGTIGWLYKALDQDVDVEVALKIISPKLLQTAEEQANFIDAAKKAKKIRHPNLIKLFDSGYEDNLSYYTMPYTQGLSLDKIISLRRESNSLFSMDELFGLFSQIATAIDALSEYGAICSLKPTNIIVLPDLLKITGVPDYQGLPRFPYVAMQQKKNTLCYMDPLAQKEGSVCDQRADIYSMAVILGEMLTGYKPSENREAFDQAIASQPQNVRIAFTAALTYTDEEGLEGYSSAYDFMQQMFPEKMAQDNGAITEDVAADIAQNTAAAAAPAPASPVVSEAALNALAEEPQFPAMPPSAPAAVAPAADTEISVVPATSPVEEELELDADEIEEEILPIPGAQAVPAVASEVKAASVPPVATAAVEEAPPPPSPPQILTADSLIKQPSAKKKSGVLPAIIGVLAVGALCTAAFLYFYKPQTDNNNAAAAAVTDSSSDRQTVAVANVPKEANEAAATTERSRNQSAGRSEKTKNEKVAANSREKDDKSPPVVREKELSQSDSQEPAGKKESAVANKADNKEVVTTAEKTAPLTAKKEVEERGDNSAAQKVLPQNVSGDLSELLGGTAGDDKGGTCPPDMIYIPAGTFKMGTAANDSMRGFDDKDLTTKNVKAFCIDIYEYPNQAGAKVTQGLSFGQAQKHCQQKGKRLCREEEWEKACKGPNNYRFPYGNRYNATQCNMGSAAVPAGQYSRCKSGYGLMDMAGNVAEWTSTKLEPDLPDRIYKGGAYGLADWAGRCSARFNAEPNSHEAILGVRCCKQPL